MANELLKFRKGKYADLASVAKDPGTIYVTTDEQAMYVDIDKDTRIRLGETVHFATLANFQDFLKGTKPPYNPQAFYYIDAENALLKWVPSGGTYNPDVDGDGNGDSNGTWKQINSTAALTAEINSIKNEISGLNTAVAANTAAIDTNKTAIATNTAAIGTASTGDGSGKDDDNKKATGLHALIEANKKAIESNNAEIESLGANKLDKTEFETFKTTNAAAIQEIDNKVGTKNDTSNSDTAFGRIKALEESNAKKASQTDVDALKTTVYGGTDKNQDTAADGSLVKKVAALETNSATKAELKEVSDKVDEQATDIADLRKDLGNTTDTSTATTTAFGRIAKLEAAVGDGTGESLSGRVGKLETTVGDKDSGLVKDVNDIQTTLGNKENPAAGTIYKEIADIKDKNGQQDTSIANLEKVLNGDTQGTDQNAKDGVLTRLSKVETKAANNATAIGTKPTEGVTGSNLWEAVKNAQDKGTANATAIGTKGTGVTGDTLWEAVKNAQTSASSNSTEITNIKNGIGTKPEGATTLWSAIQQNATDIDTLEQTIANEINAANGMTYKGGVGSANAINAITAPEIGDTYVATEAFTFTQEGKTVQVYAGDLLVASGTETNGVITADLKWTLVNTGYIQAHEATLGVAATPKGAQINLNSYVSTLSGTPNSGDLGKVQIVSDNLIITSTYNDATKTSEIKINAVWGDFGAST